MRLPHFQCAECQAPLIGTPSASVVCDRCGTPVATVDGILDFVRAPTGPLSDPEQYDALHHIDDERSAARYRDLKHLAAERWPTMLGSVLEVGCGTGLLTRAMVQNGDASDAVVTDISLPMLRATRAHLEKSGLLSRIPLTFATHDGTEPVFRDATFDTCAGTSVLHHMLDVRGFLSHTFRWLEPGGRAFFTEPNLRYHRALGQTLADILAVLYREDPAFSHGKQSLLNTVSQWRRGILHQGDLPFLAGLEDKHMFAADAFETMGREVGFETVLAIPVSYSPTGMGFVRRMCDRMSIGDPVRASVLGLLPAFADRYMSLLSPRDRTPSFLFWMEKGIGPTVRRFHGPPAAEAQPPEDLPEAFRTGGLPPRWAIELTASRVAEGIAVKIGGWCLVNTDVLWLRLVMNGVARQAPVWLPRPDVQAAINPIGVYASWNALCCGVDESLVFPDGALVATAEIVLSGGTVVPIPLPASLLLDETVFVIR
jgi:2-polyprenyl-3-methyl-5-hydroxy-6-metoxy-1,4-benzoquinol methylase